MMRPAMTPNPGFRPNRVGPVVTILGLAAAAWLALSQRHLKQLRSALDAERDRQAVATQEGRRLEQEAAGRKNRERVGAPDRPQTVATPPVAHGPAPRRLDGPVAALIQSPALQAQYLEAKRSRIERSYGPLFKSLNLSTDQIARFGDLLMQREQQALDIAGAVPGALNSNFSDGQWFTGSLTLSVGGPAGSADAQAAAKLMQQAKQGFQHAATDLLGPDGYGQLATFERARPMRGVVDDVAGSLATSSSPLTPDQANQLTQLLAGASASYAKGRTATLSPIDWDQVLQQAPGVLSPPQVASLNQVIGMRHAQDQLRDLIRATTAPAGTAPGAH